MQSQSSLQPFMHGLLIDDRQLPRKPHADGTSVDVRFMIKSIAAAGAEHFRLCGNLRVNFKSYNSFKSIVHNNKIGRKTSFTLAKKTRELKSYTLSARIF